MDIVTFLTDTGNQTTVLILLVLAVFRVYLELVKFNFAELPMTKALAERTGQGNMKAFHRVGLILSVGYIVLFAPGYLIS